MVQGELYTDEEDEALFHLFKIHGRDIPKLQDELRALGYWRTREAIRSRLSVFNVRKPRNFPNEVEMLANHRPWRTKNVS